MPGKLGGIAERRELEIHEGEPERRSMAFTRTASGVCIANLHATNDIPEAAVGTCCGRSRRRPSGPAARR